MPSLPQSRKRKFSTSPPRDLKVPPFPSQALKQLVLSEAGRVVRSVPGCPPAPRLVCVETNPGPNPIRSAGRDLIASAIGEAAAAITMSAASKAKKKKKNTKKRKGARPGKTALSNVVSLQNSYTKSLGVTNVSVMRSSSSTPTFALPFDNMLIPVTSTTPGGLTQFGTGGITALDFDPNAYTATGAGSSYFFGNAVGAVANVFTRFRFTKLRAYYVPMVSSSTAGSLTFAYTPDGAALNTTSRSFSDVASTNGSVTTPVWQGVEIALPGLITDWLYVHDPNTVTTSSERQTAAGTILVSSFAALTAGSSFGLIRLAGVVEFQGLGPAPQLVARRSEEQKQDQTLPYPIQKVEIIAENDKYVEVGPSSYPPGPPQQRYTPRL